MSMIRIKSLTLEGFRSISEPVTVDFDNINVGLTFMTGTNLYEPDLGANGVGKSTIGEGIVWIIAGKTSVNLKAKTVCNWDKNNKCSGTLLVEKDGKTISIKRTWNPNSLSVDDTVISQEELERILGYDFDSIVYSTIISQFGSKFFDLRPEQKMAVFSSIMKDQLDRWNKRSIIASDKSKELENFIIDVDNELAKYIGKIETLENNDYLTESDNWEREHATNIERVGAEIKRIKLELNESSDLLAKVAAKLKTTQKEFDILSKDKVIEAEEKEISKLTKSERELERDIIVANKELTNTAEEIRNVSKLQGICPTCKKSVTEKDKEAVIASLKDTMSHCSSSKAKLERKRVIISRKIEEVSGRVQTRRNKLLALSTSIRELSNDSSVIQSKMSPMTSMLKSSRKNLSMLKDMVNPYSKLIEDTSVELAAYKRFVEYATLDKEELSSKLETCRYWQRGFKDMRLIVLEESLAELTVYVNNNLRTLGMSNWRVELTIENSTQNGKVRRELLVMIKSPRMKDKVPLEAWSGGEGQRIRLAGTLGLMDFIHNRRGNDWDVEMFDEPTTWLSEKGQEQLLEALRMRAERLDKKILIADHRDFNTYGGFVNVIVVTKDDNGTSIRVDDR